MDMPKLVSGSYGRRFSIVIYALHPQPSGLDPAVTAAWIAAGFSVLTLIVTTWMQYVGIRRVSNDTNDSVREQLAEQRHQLERTLAEQRDRTLNERFATAVDRLEAERSPAVRLAAIYALAGLADDWQENRQTCVDVLCAYIRMPYEPDPGVEALAAQRLAFRANQEVRHAAIRVITNHLRADAATPWHGLNFDFRGARFDGGSFAYAEFSSGQIDFSRAEFADGDVFFHGAKFSGSVVYFQTSEFSGGMVTFYSAEFSGGRVDFLGAKFCGSDVYFFQAEFSGALVDFGKVDEWSKPPMFSFEGAPPPGVTLPPSDPARSRAAD
jgi:hypothetical protein